jgi:rod shape-determining protein MreD
VTKKIPVTIFLLVITCLLQLFGFSHLVLFNVTVDAVTIFLAVVSVLFGQRIGMTFGFGAGLFIGSFTGHPGLEILVRTMEGFVAGYCSVPPDSHATSKQKSRKLYLAIVLAVFAGNIIFALGMNPLALPFGYRVFILGGVEALLSLFVTFVLNRFFLRKILSE